MEKNRGIYAGNPLTNPPSMLVTNPCPTDHPLITDAGPDGEGITPPHIFTRIKGITAK